MTTGRPNLRRVTRGSSASERHPPPVVRVSYDGLSMVKADLISRVVEATDLEQ